MIILSLAWRNIWRNTVRSFLIMLSVAIGIFCGMMVLGIYKGMMSGRIKTLIESETGHIQIADSLFKEDYEPRYILKNNRECIDSLLSSSDVKSISCQSLTLGMLSTTGGSSGVKIIGINPFQEASVNVMFQLIDKSSLIYGIKKNWIVMGNKLAIKLKLKKKNKLVLTFTDTASNLISASFRIAEIYHSSNTKLEETNVFIDQKTLNDLLGIEDNFHQLIIRLYENESTENVQHRLQLFFPHLFIQSWKEISPETALLINTVDVYSYIIISIILIALSFGIINTMLMSVLERTREVGMMMALGLNRKKLFMLILIETIFLTIIGTPLGMFIAFITCTYYQSHGIDWSGMGKEMMSSFGFNTTIYPEFPVEKIPLILFLVITTALLSCLMPAIKALHLKPVEALRK